MIGPKNETEYLLLSITKNCELLIKETHTKAKETLDFKLSQPNQKFHSNPPISIEGSWMMGLPSSEVYNSIFNSNYQNIKFKLYKFPDSRSDW